MNISHMKYAVEVARLGSLNKASETLMTAQPNISRSIKELEADLGIKIFDRSAKGMFLTADGEEFITYAKMILGQLDGIEALYRRRDTKKQKFSVCVPRASYISEAFVEFSKSLKNEPCEIYYKETNSQKAIDNLILGKSRLAIVRYAEIYGKHFKALFEEKGVSYEIISEFTHRLLVSSNSPLAKKEKIREEELSEFTELAHADHFVPSLSPNKVIKEEISENIRKKLFLFERCSALELLSENPDCFMWVSPTPKKLLRTYGLTELAVEDNKKAYRDVLIYKKDLRLSALENQFIIELCASKRRNW